MQINSHALNTLNVAKQFSVHRKCFENSFTNDMITDSITSVCIAIYELPHQSIWTLYSMDFLHLLIQAHISQFKAVPSNSGTSSWN